MASQANGPAAKSKRSSGDTLDRKEKQEDVRTANIVAARGIADAIRTSLGPKGMDKMIETSGGEVVITNDGATILDKMEVQHPAAKMLVDLSKAQDSEAGDGTTSVVVLAGALLTKSEELLEKGIHPTVIAEAYKKAAKKTEAIFRSSATPINIDQKSSDEGLQHAVITSLNSKVVSQFSRDLAPLAVAAVRRVIDPSVATTVDLNDIRVVSKKGGTVEDTELIDGLVFKQESHKGAGGPSRVTGCKIGVIQFHLSAPKTDMENQIIVQSNEEMDRLAKDEKRYILKMVKKIAKTGCNVLLVQKSILRDAVNVLSLHYLARKNIMVVTEVERAEVEFVCRSLGCRPVAHPDQFTPDKLGEAQLAEEISTAQGRLVKITGVKNPGKTVSILVRGSNNLVLEEAERSLHDALCVVRCLVKEKFLIAGGGSPESEAALRLVEYAETLGGLTGYCVRAFAEALEVIPLTLAENAGLHPIKMVTELRLRHKRGEKHAGINVKRGTVSNMWDEHVIQPLLVSTNAVNLAAETVRMILKIDDIVQGR